MGFGILMGLLASASWACANVFIQRASRALGPFRALVWALSSGGLALLPVGLALDHRTVSLGTGTLTGWLVVAALAAVLAYTSMFFAVERGRLSVVVPVMSSWSVIAAAISLGVLGQTLRRGQLAGAAAVVAGVLVIARFAQQGAAGDKAPASPAGGIATSSGPSQGSEHQPSALGMSALTALGFGVLIPAIDRLAPALGRLGAVSAVLLVDLLLWLPLSALVRLDVRPPSRRHWPLVLAAGAFETIGFVWISVGIAHAPVAVVSPFAGLSSAFTVLYAWVALGERPPRAVLAGAVLVCAGVVVLAL